MNPLHWSCCKWSSCLMVARRVVWSKRERSYPTSDASSSWFAKPLKADNEIDSSSCSKVRKKLYKSENSFCFYFIHLPVSLTQLGKLSRYFSFFSNKIWTSLIVVFLLLFSLSCIFVGAKNIHTRRARLCATGLFANFIRQRIPLVCLLLQLRPVSCVRIKLIQIFGIT